MFMPAGLTTARQGVNMVWVVIISIQKSLQRYTKKLRLANKL